MADRKDTCESCRFFAQSPVEGDEDYMGECRIGRPKLGIGLWPFIQTSYWCGEHEALPEAVKAEEVKAEGAANREITQRHNPYGKGLVGCTSCDLEMNQEGTPHRTVDAWAAHKCEDHQPANEESDL